MIDDVMQDAPAPLRSSDLLTTVRNAGTRKQMALANQKAKEIVPIIQELRGQGLKSLRQIAKALNDREILTRRGKKWYANTLKRMIDRAS